MSRLALDAQPAQHHAGEYDGAFCGRGLPDKPRGITRAREGKHCGWNASAISIGLHPMAKSSPRRGSKPVPLQTVGRTQGWSNFAGVHPFGCEPCSWGPRGCVGRKAPEGAAAVRAAAALQGGADCGP